MHLHELMEHLEIRMSSDNIPYKPEVDVTCINLLIQINISYTDPRIR